MAKPDDRSDNVDKLQEMISNTEQNLHEAQDSLRAHGHEMSATDVSDIQAKNQRRLQSIQGFKEEIRDEATDN